MNKTKIRNKVHFLLLLAFFPCVLWASADWTITIDMTVIKPLCKVNNDQEILIDFEKVATTKIDGKEYKKKPIKFTITCPDNSADLKVQINGNTTSFAVGDKLLETDNSDLGIKILADNKGLPVNTWLSFSWPQQVPELEAVLVKRDGATLSGGQFKAGAVMKLAYN